MANLTPPCGADKKLAADRTVRLLEKLADRQMCLPDDETIDFIFELCVQAGAEANTAAIQELQRASEVPF